MCLCVSMCVYVDQYVFMSPVTAPPHFYSRGGKPLLENPSSTVWKPSSLRVNPNDSEHSLTKGYAFFA